MKRSLILFIPGFFCSALANAQQMVTGKPFPVQTHTIHFNFITRDSVNLAYDNDFALIEDSCSQITRYGHLNMQQHHFLVRSGI